MHTGSNFGEAAMEHEVMTYFENARVPDAQKSLARRSGRELYRGNISTMGELCSLCEGGPEKLLEIRNIGKKSAALILAVCAMYKEENKGQGNGQK